MCPQRHRGIYVYQPSCGAVGTGQQERDRAGVTSKCNRNYGIDELITL